MSHRRAAPRRAAPLCQSLNSYTLMPIFFANIHTVVLKCTCRGLGPRSTHSVYLYLYISRKKRNKDFCHCRTNPRHFLELSHSRNGESIHNATKENPKLAISRVTASFTLLHNKQDWARETPFISIKGKRCKWTLDTIKLYVGEKIGSWNRDSWTTTRQHTEKISFVPLQISTFQSFYCNASQRN